jgi:hypothetical protein
MHSFNTLCLKTINSYNTVYITIFSINSIQSCRWTHKFRRNMLPPSSGSKRLCLNVTRLYGKDIMNKLERTENGGSEWVNSNCIPGLVMPPFPYCVTSSLWLGLSCGDYTPTAPTAPSLRTLVPSCSLLMCQ